MNGTRFEVNPGTANVVYGAKQQFTALLDSVQVAEVTWSVDGQAGTIDATGLYTAPTSGTLATVTATLGDLSATAAVALHPVLPLPSLSAVSPNLANAGAPDLALTVTGTDFGPTTDVLFDEVRLQTRFDSSTQLTATVPAASLALGRVAVVTAQTPGLGGTSVGASFTIDNPAATLGSINPASALAGSSQLPLVLTGTGFAQGAVVTFGGTPLASAVSSPTQLTATLPAAQLLKSGVFTVAVRNPSPGGGGAGDQVFRIDAVIKTVAGGFSGDNGIAGSAALSRINWMAFHPTTAELYYSEPERHRVMKVDLTGRIRKVAGTGVCGFSGDGAAASQALVCTPRGLGFDGAGNLYFADAGNARLRKIDALGTIATVAGIGTCNYTGEGAATTVSVGDISDVRVAGSGNIYFSAIGCTSNYRIRKLSGGMLTTLAGTGTNAASPDGSVANVSSINNPISLAVDAAENVYFTEYDGHRIRKIAAATGLLWTAAGNAASSPFTEGVSATASSIYNPRNLVFDAAGAMFVTSYSGFRVRKVTAPPVGPDAGTLDGGGPVGNISTVAGSGVGGFVSGDGMDALLARVGHSAAVAISPDGGLYFSSTADTGAGPNTIKRLDSAGKLQPAVGTFPSNLTALDSFFFRPYGVGLDGTGALYLAERENDRLWKIDAAGNVTAFAGTGLRGFSGEGGPATQANISQPEAIQVDANGDVYFLDTGNSRVRKIDSSGNIATVAGGGSTPAGCVALGSAPTAPPGGAGPAYDCYGDDYFATAAVLIAPRGLLKAGNNLYISEYDNTFSSVQRGHRVRKVNLTSGVITTVAGNTAFGNTSGFAGDNGPATGASLNQPAGMAIDPIGDLYVADSGNRRIRKINLVTTPLGQISTVAGTGVAGSSGNGGLALVAQFRRPWSLAFDAQGALYVSDLESHNVRRIEPNDTVTPIAGPQTCGTCTPGFAGDGAAAKDSSLYSPTQLTLSPSGQLFIADSLNERVRALGP